MALTDLYEIISLKVQNDCIRSTLKINGEHEIFEGHFPGNPVMPGVCMIHMIKSILEKFTDKKCDLIKSSQVKFLSILSPVNINQIEAEIQFSESGNFEVNGKLFYQDVIFLKIKATFRNR